MRLSRRDFLRAAWALPLGGSLARFEALAAPARGLVKITRITALQTKRLTLTRIDTDAGVTGYGP